MLDPDKPFSSRPRKSAGNDTSVATAKADLTGLLDRARDERFRLLKMLKDARAEVAVTLQSLPPTRDLPASKPIAETPTPPPAIKVHASPPLVAVDPDRTKALIAKLTELNTRIDQKLRRADQLADEKLARLETIEARITRQIENLDVTQASAEREMIDKVNAHRQRMAELTDAADRELQAHAQRLDDAVAGLTELFERQADHLVADLRARASAALDHAKPDADRRAA